MVNSSPRVTADAISLGFQALSDPIRLTVLTLLQPQEQCVCDLCEQLGISQSKLSFHLKRLKDANLVSARQEGRWMYYRLNPAQFAVLQDYLSAYGQSPAVPLASPRCCES